MSEPTADHLLGGRLSLFQAAKGHRAGTDAILLAAAAAALGEGGAFVDVGAGVGAAGLALALLRPSAHGLLLEADPAHAALGRRNCAANGVADRVEVVEADLFAPPARRPARESAALVLTNPPFFLPGEVRASPDAGRASAHVMGPRGHGDWLVAAVALLAPKGRFVTIHRPQALAALLAACEGRLGGVAVRPIQAREGGDAVRILLSGTKGSRGSLRVAPPFVLHGPDGAFTDAAGAVHRGDALIAI